MDNRKIEQNAVNAVKQAFGDVACVYAYIDENDKTECTDGHLQVYSSSSFTIETVEGQSRFRSRGPLRKENRTDLSGKFEFQTSGTISTLLEAASIFTSTVGARLVQRRFSTDFCFPMT